MDTTRNCRPIHEDPLTYNYAHFRVWHAIEELSKSLQAPSVGAGDAAPDFQLPRTDGGELSLAELRGSVVLVRFTSIT